MVYPQIEVQGTEVGRATELMHVWFCALAAATLAALTPAFAEDELPAVVPYRPTVSNPAELPAPGYPELEGGFLRTQGGDAARTDSLPLLFKLAWSENWGVLIGTDGYTWRHEFDGTYAQSSGDVRVVLKQRIPVSKTLALGVEYGVQLPMARVRSGLASPTTALWESRATTGMTCASTPTSAPHGWVP